MSSSIGRSGRRISRTVFVAAAFVCAECCAAVAGAQDGLPSAAASERAGVLPLPTGPPPTGLQSPLPKPARPLAKPDRPLLASPSLAVLGGHYASQPLTINDAVAVALATSRSLELANQALFEAQGRTSEARAGFRPTLGGNFTYTRLNTGETVSFGGQSFTIVNPDQPVFALSATLPIDIAGMLHAATDQARFQEIAARIDVNRACNELVADVKGAFYSVLRSRALVVVAGENLDDSLARLGDAQAKFHAGTVARLDVIRAQTDVANAQQQLIQARSGVSQAIAVLNNTIGIDVNWPTQVSDKGAVAEPPNVAAARSSSAPFGSPAPPADFGSPRASVSASVNATPHASSVAYDSLDLGPAYESAFQEALRTRPEILEADAVAAAAAKGIVLARRSTLPTLGVSLGGTYSPLTAGLSPVSVSAEMVVSVSVPIYDAGVARARLREARGATASARTNRRQVVDAVALDVRQAYLALVQARDQVAVANQTLGEAREAFRLARVRYNAGVSANAGVSPLLEVSDAQNALVQAENNQVNALYNFNNARAALDRAVGRYSYAAADSGIPAPPSLKARGRTTRE